MSFTQLLYSLFLLSLSLSPTTSTILITSPLQTQFKDNQLSYIYANFGQIPYGKTSSFTLQLLSQSLCNDNDLDKHYTKPTYVVIRQNVETCSFTKRALIAQNKGAKGIIIATRQYDGVKGNVLQGDDGNGKKVHISVLFISISTYTQLSQLKNKEITVNYPIPKQTISTLTLFISASKRSSYIFLRQLYSQYKSLQKYMKIDVVYHTVQCQGCSSENCIFDKYCCFDYEDYNFKVGQKIIYQQLHQYAIFMQRGVGVWFQYMGLFDDYCMGDWDNVQECKKKIMGQMGMRDVIMPNPEDTLSWWQIRETRLGFDTFPQVAINSMIYLGNFQTPQIMQTFCQSLESQPQYCLTGQPQSPSQPQPTNNHLAIIIISSILALIAMVMAVICLYRRFIKKEMTNDMASRVGEIVANYANKVSKIKIRQKEKFIQANDQEL